MQFFHYRLFLSFLFFLLQDLIFNGIQISMEFNTGDIKGIFSIFSSSIDSILSFLHYLLQDCCTSPSRRISIRRIDAVQS
jgi:hypothetical protein